MRKAWMGSVVVLLLTGCGAGSYAGAPAPATALSAARAPEPVTVEPGVATDRATDAPRPSASGNWIGASAESEMVMAGADETVLGVWVDAPSARSHVRPRIDLALVIDTSGSMAGDKIANARGAALALVDSLEDGDIVSVDTFSDDARVLVTPTAIDAMTRARIRSVIEEVRVGGGTNMFDGLSLGESQVARAPSTHAVRRVVLLSDGMANVGPSSPEALGLLAERGLAQGAQVTSLGVGIDYDERTLNALAVRSSGRLYHLGELREMASILRREMDLLGSTVASDAFVEIVPANGVELVREPGVHAEMSTNGTIRIPLGVLFAGQHREALVRARFRNASDWAQGPKPIASVRLHFRDPSEGDLDRVQEVVARVESTHDSAAVAAHANARTQSIIAVQDAANLQIHAAEEVNQGQFAAADKALAVAQQKLEAQASNVKDDVQRQRLTHAAAGLASARASTAGAAAAPAPMRREKALELNSAGMHDNGF